MHVFAIRYGETEWSLSGQHTGATDIALTDNGRRVAERMRPLLVANPFRLVFCSPCGAQERPASWRAGNIFCLTRVPCLSSAITGKYPPCASGMGH